MKVTFLGTGSSLGIPVIGCSCQVCTSDDPGNKRDRPSVLISYNDKNILIDTSPDFRQQALRCNVSTLDAVIYTHAHADHIFGLDDLRIIIERRRKPLPLYCSQETLERLKSIFGYAFDARIWHTDMARLQPQIIEGEFELFGKRIHPVPVLHDRLEVLGFRFEDFAYLTDVSYISEESIKLLAGVKTLVISALRRKPHIKHIELDRIIELAIDIGVENAWLTHISHELEHSWLKEYCPEHINPAFDGMVLEL